MELFTIAQVANRFKVSTTYIYKLIKTRPEMQGLVVKKGKRRTYLKPEAIQFLTDVISLKPGSPKFETEENSQKETVSNQDSNLSELIETLKNQLETKDNLINELIEKEKQERHRTDTILMTLSNQIAEQGVQIQNQSKQLEDLRKESELTKKPKKKISRPEPVSTPEENSTPSFKQQIIYFFKPHLQRKRA